jgi:hypothetical protein
LSGAFFLNFFEFFEYITGKMISIPYELIEFVYNVHLHEIVKLRKTAL